MQFVGKVMCLTDRFSGTNSWSKHPNSFALYVLDIMSRGGEVQLTE